MRNIFLKFSVSILTFTMGVLLVAISSFAFFQEETDCCSKSPQPTIYPVSENDTIEIRFGGYGRQENRPTLKFEIINHSLKPAKYTAQVEKSPFAHVKFNGKNDDQIWYCGMGAKEFEIRSGESITTELSGDTFFYRNLRKKGKFQVGFWLSLDDKYEQYWSDEFQISESWKEEIIRNAPDWFKNNSN